VDTSVSDEERFTIGSIPAAVYPAMLGATVGGQLLGIGIDALLLGRHVLWIPALCSVLLEAVVGVGIGASRLGRPLTVAQCGRLSAYYSLGLTAITLPLWGWTAATHSPGAPVSGAHVCMRLAAFAAAIGAATLVRWGLMALLVRRGGAGP
jgi:hypothetical protein